MDEMLNTLYAKIGRLTVDVEGRSAAFLNVIRLLASIKAGAITPSQIEVSEENGGWWKINPRIECPPAPEPCSEPKSEAECLAAMQQGIVAPPCGSSDAEAVASERQANV